MLKSGNNNVNVCLNNLLALTESEVQIDQTRGLEADIVGMPTTTAFALLQSSAFWVAKRYEPRANFTGLDRSPVSAESGEFSISPKTPS